MIGSAERLFWEASMTGAALVSKQGMFTKVNPSFCRIVEYTEPELLKKNFADITAPEDLDADKEQAEKVAAGIIEGYSMIKRYLTKRNRVVWVQLQVDPVRDSNGKFLCFLAQIVGLGPTKEEIKPIPGPTMSKEVAILEWFEANRPFLLFFSGILLTIGFGLSKIVKWLGK